MSGHSHDHSHAHSHTPVNFGRSFAVATALNMALVIGEVFYGLSTNSLALLADAGHNFGDVMGLLLAWGAYAIADWVPNSRYTYRMRSASILAALANGVLLVAATAIIAWEAIQRFNDPTPIATGTVIAVAAIAVLVNGASAWLLSHGSKSDLNMRGAFLHMVADAAVSVAVIIGAVAIIYTGWHWIDPAVSLLISAVILWGTWGLLRDSFHLSMNAAPSAIDPAAVRQYLEGLPRVVTIHDLHIWAVSTTETALTCHLVMPAGHPGDDFLHQIADQLRHRFEIGHPTLQIETAASGRCALAPDTVI
jgi:cobalt-zinc-cadmium efflux system protein